MPAPVRCATTRTRLALRRRGRPAHRAQPPGGIYAAAGIGLRDLDVHVITAPTLRLDLSADRDRLERTIADLAPGLLVLDPFVRLHRIDENASGEVAPLLAYLRELQRRYHLAVLLVHHAKKSGGRLRAGQALRGSSEFHAWGDSNLYLRRDGPKLTLTIEHRAAPSTPAIDLELVSRNEALALQVVTSAPCENPTATSIDQRITAALIDASQPLSISQLRPLCRVRKATLCERLTAMTETTTKRGLMAAKDLACAPAVAYAPSDGSGGRLWVPHCIAGCPVRGFGVGWS